MFNLSMSLTFIISPKSKGEEKDPEFRTCTCYEECYKNAIGLCFQSANIHFSSIIAITFIKFCVEAVRDMGGRGK